MADSAGQSRYERLTAEQMDEQRIQNVAYQYLCRLEEAKRWMEACLGEELPPPTELEEALRNGVILAKLGHHFAPTTVSLKKIYDLEQHRYQALGLQFRHTDNINHWRNAMTVLGLPAIFHPETTDVYDKKNMPRAVYCIHALSLYLYRLGLAPQIHDLYGKVKFTEEEINNMKLELDKYGIQMPAFNKIGGILANELSVDEAAVHAAVIAINEAVDKQDVGRMAAALRNPNAMLSNLQEALISVYQEILRQAKGRKAEWAAGRPIYTPCSVSVVCLSVAAVNQAVKENKVNQTLRVLSLPELELQGLVSNCAADYQRELTALITQRIHKGDNRSPWVRVQLEDGAFYHFHLSRLEGSWERPNRFIHNSVFIDRHEIQDIINSVSGSSSRNILWRGREALVVHLQALCRGFLIRQQLKSRQCYLISQAPAVIIIQIQSFVKMWLARRNYRARLSFFRRNVSFAAVFVLFEDIPAPLHYELNINRLHMSSHIYSEPEYTGFLRGLKK
uniref:ras GTPase-activating-like protein IQGAP1 n=1 Tax=Monopterus albus TaxID=43700 RepID=UPI0009B3C6DA|nr:ras GTPase-activating-like protein IQGAP1 [Monopterus albus]